MFSFWKKQPTVSQLILPQKLPELPKEAKNELYIKVGLDETDHYVVEVNCPSGQESEFTYLTLMLNNGVLYPTILEAINNLPKEQCAIIYNNISQNDGIMQDAEKVNDDNDDDIPLISPLFALHSLKGGQQMPNSDT